MSITDLYEPAAEMRNDSGMSKSFDICNISSDWKRPAIQSKNVELGSNTEPLISAAIDRLYTDPKNALYMNAEKIRSTAKILEIADSLKTLSRWGEKLAGDMYCYRGISTIVPDVCCHSFFVPPAAAKYLLSALFLFVKKVFGPPTSSQVENPGVEPEFKIAAIDISEYHINRVRDFGRSCIELFHRLVDIVSEAVEHIKICNRVPWFLQAFCEVFDVIVTIDAIKRANVNLGNSLFSYKRYVELCIVGFASCDD